MHGVDAKGVDCPAIDGILKEASEIAGEVADKSVLDAALIAAAQAVEHYEITRYGTLIAWAKQIGRSDCASVLQQNLDEEKATRFRASLRSARSEILQKRPPHSAPCRFLFALTLRESGGFRVGRMKVSTMFRLIALCVCLFATAAVAADVPSATKTFIDKVAVSNKFEIDTSELALKYGKSADVKAFAQQMIDDHKKAGADFKTSLAQANIEPPADSLDVSHTAKYAKLRLFTTEKGFDSAYVDAQLQAHEDAVATFKDYAANGPTPALKSFAEKTLPILEHHLEMVKTLRSKTPAKD